MGLLDSITSRASSTLRSVEDRAESAVKSVEAKAESAVKTVEAKVDSAVGSVKSAATTVVDRAESTFTAAKADAKKVAQTLGQVGAPSHSSSAPTIQAKDLQANFVGDAGRAIASFVHDLFSKKPETKPADPPATTPAVNTPPAQVAPPPPPPTPVTPAGTTSVQVDGKPVAVATSATGTVPADAWSHPEEVLKNLSQYNRSNVMAGADNCGPSGALGSAIVNGPAATSKLLKSVAANNGGKLSATESARLNELAAKVDAKTIKFEELNEAQGLIYKGNKPPNNGTGFSLGEVQQMNAQHLAGVDSQLPTAGTPPKANLGAVMDGLRPGQSAVVLIAGVAGTKDMDHYLTIGKGTDGKPYIYNPDPDLKAGDKVMVSGDDARKALGHYSQRMFSSTQPGFQGQWPKVTTVTPPT